MQVDEAKRRLHAVGMRLGVAITRALLDNQKSRSWLAEQLGKNEATVSRYLNGKIALTVDQVVGIEQTLGLPLGYLLRSAGLVEDRASSTAEAIAADPQLRSDQREALLVLYEQFQKSQ